MQNENFEFNFNEAPVVFKENVSRRSSLIHKEAITRAQRYLIAEADLLEINIEIDKERIYEEFGLTHLTPYCVKHIGLSEDVAANFVRVARKFQQVPELKVAIYEGLLSVTKAKAISSVITTENHEVWIDKAQSLSKEKLEKEVAYNSPNSKKPEKAKVSGPDRVRMEYDLTLAEMKLFRRVQDLVSQKLKKSATLAETQSELVKLYLEQRDPVIKAERARRRSLAKKSAALEKKDSPQRPVPGPLGGALALLFPAIILTSFFLGAEPHVIQFGEAIAMSVVFWLITFLIPSGFLQVSKTGRYMSAFHLINVVQLIFKNLRGYLEAWVYSGLVSILGHLWGLRYPWAIFWSYQSILYAFNEILYHEEKDQGHLAKSLFARFNSASINTDKKSVKVQILGIDIPKMEAS